MALLDIDADYIAGAKCTEEVCICVGTDIIYEIAEEGIRRINAFYGEEWLADNGEMLEKLHCKPKHCLFALQDQVIVGYAIIRKETEKEEEVHYHVSWIAVDSSQKRRGIGTQLMQKVVEISRSKGYRFLSLCHKKDDSQLMRFYDRIGEIYRAKVERTLESEKEYRLLYTFSPDLSANFSGICRAVATICGQWLGES